MTFDLAWIRGQFPGREIHWHDTIDSTMNEAARLAKAGAPNGTAVIADQQTAGVGRYGRQWHSEPRAGLYVSVVIRPPAPLLTLALGLAARQAILSTTSLACDLRWPNDLLLGDLKCAGILVNLEGSAAVAGIGVNVNHDALPEDIASFATSLRLASGVIHAREPLLVVLLQAIGEWTVRPQSEILSAFSNTSSYARGRRVIVDNTTEGTTAGLDEQGFLLLRKDNGEVIRILAGGVRPVS